MLNSCVVYWRLLLPAVIVSCVHLNLSYLCCLFTEATETFGQSLCWHGEHRTWTCPVNGLVVLSVYTSQRFHKRKSASWNSHYAPVCRAWTAHRQTALEKGLFVGLGLLFKADTQ